MNEKKRNEVFKTLLHFGNKKVTEKELVMFLEENKFQPITIGEYSDYKLQMDIDKKAEKYLLELIELLKKLRYVPEFDEKEKRDLIVKTNGELEVEIAKLLEEQAVPYFVLESFNNNIANILRQTVEGGQTRILNKTTSALIDIAKDKFGSEFNTLHSKEYYDEKYKKAE